MLKRRPLDAMEPGTWQSRTRLTHGLGNSVLLLTIREYAGLYIIPASPSFSSLCLSAFALVIYAAL